MNKQFFSGRFFILCGLIIAGALTRLIPHPDNFTAIGAIALFGGAHLANRKLAFIIPFLAMMLADMFLPFGFNLWIYAAFAGIVAIGLLLRERKGFMPVLFASLASSVLFFIISNFAVWFSGGIYTRDIAGLIECYIAAIPFFGNTLAGDMFYCGVFFGGFYLIEKRYPVLVR